MPPPPLRPRRSAAGNSDAADRAHIDRARRLGTPAARAEAVEALMPLALSFARRYQRGEEPLEDLQQVACLGLLKAIDGFDPDRGIPFRSFATPTIIGELRRHFRDKGWGVRVPRALQELSLRVKAETVIAAADYGRPPTVRELAQRLGVGEEAILEAREAVHAMRPVSLDRPASFEDGEVGETMVDRLPATETGYGRVDDVAQLESLLRTLPVREREVLDLRFREELTQVEIGQRIGISQMHVSRVLRSALTKLNAAAEA